MDVEPIAFSTQLHDLNDDCIFAILEGLSLDDLCSFALTCSRFYKLSHEYFRYKYSRQVVVHERLTSKIFIIFGGYMSGIMVKTNVARDPNIPAIFTYCKNDVQRIFRKIHKFCPNARTIQTKLSFDGPAEIRRQITRQMKERLNTDYIHYMNRLKAKMIEQQQISHSRIQPPLPIALMPLNDLDDSCVRAIFINLNFDLLFPFARTNPRFWSIARDIFAKEYKQEFVLTRFTDPRKLNLYGDRIRFVDIQTTKYMFADNAKLVFKDQLEMLHVIRRHMTHVDVVKCDAMEHKTFCSKMWRDILPTISALILSTNFDPLVSDPETSRTLDYFGNLTSLTLNMQRFDDKTPDSTELFMRKSYPKLRYACIRGNLYSPDALTEFCRLNPQLKEMSAEIASKYAIDFASVRYLQNLEKLIFATNGNGFGCDADVYKWLYRGLAEIKTLRFLDVHSAEWHCDSIAILRQLTHFKMPTSGFGCPDKLDLMARHMPNLTVCMFPCNGIDDNVYNFIRNCVNLKELYVYRLREAIGDNILMRLVELCEYQNRKLILHVCPDGENVLIWDDVLEEFSHRVHIVCNQWYKAGNDDKFLNPFSGYEM